MKWNKGDTYLLIVGVLFVAIFATNTVLEVFGFDQLTAGCWTFCGIVLGGEVVVFALKKAFEYSVDKKEKNDEDRKAG